MRELAERNVEQPIRTYPAYTVKPMEREPDVVRAVAGDIPATSVDHSSTGNPRKSAQGGITGLGGQNEQK